MKKYTLIILLQLALTSLIAQDYIDLSGNWSAKLANGQTGIAHLPGTTDEAKLGEKSVGSDFGILTRAYKYIGKAWYEREIEIPESWCDSEVELKLERVLWESTVYVDGELVGSYDALNSAHIFNLGNLSKGKHSLKICVDNEMIHNIGDKGHPYGEYTQSIWNGIVGEITLRKINKARFNNPVITTEVFPHTLTFTDTLTNRGRKGNYTIHTELKERNSDIILWTKEDKITLKDGDSAYEYSSDLSNYVEEWSDINPRLYDLTVTIESKNEIFDTYKFEVGFREIEQGKHKLILNGKPIMLRGNLDCVHFPLTGYPSCDPSDWERIFKIYKDYGLNHVRFHSWCPPSAAFVAADRVGIFIQAESVWIDWWMSAPNPRKEMDTKGYPQGLGKNPSADPFIQNELRRMVNAYGNHASFVMMCIGNELGNSDFDIMESWLEPYKESDSRRLYSVSAARKIMPVDQYMATHYVPGVGGSRGMHGASTDWDFEEVYSKSPVPTIAHEIGQWPVYPRWDEIKKYTGVLKARNFEEFYEQALANGVAHKNDDFADCSGALNQLMYKSEIESFLRTPSCAGLQLLSMQDYQGQGEALIGWLDVFYESKGITTPEWFRTHCDTLVPLLRIKRFTWNSNETLEGRVQIAHHGQYDIEDKIYWRIYDNDGICYDSDTTESIEFKIGTSNIISNISASLDKFTSAEQLNIEIGFVNRPIKNRWRFWVYPQIKKVDTKNAKKSDSSQPYICTAFDEECQERLAKGEKVLLMAARLGDQNTYNHISFAPLYWSYTFFPGQKCNTIGMVIDSKHPMFDNFPTDRHSDWQWEAIYKNARGFILNDQPKDFEIIAQPIDDFHRNNRLGGIFEAKVGNGSLIVCGFDFTSNNVGATLQQSIIEYMKSDKFSPKQSLEVNYLNKLLVQGKPIKIVAPKEFEEALIYIECAGNKKSNGDDAWDKSLDKVQLLQNSSYKVNADGCWKDDVSQAWHGKELDIQLKCPQGIIGELHLFVHDWNDNGRDGEIIVEGREFSIGEHTKDGKWIKIHIMREDSNDGILNINVSATKGPNIMITKLILVSES